MTDDKSIFGGSFIPVTVMVIVLESDADKSSYTLTVNISLSDTSFFKALYTLEFVLRSYVHTPVFALILIVPYVPIFVRLPLRSHINKLVLKSTSTATIVPVICELLSDTTPDRSDDTSIIFGRSFIEFTNWLSPTLVLPNPVSPPTVLTSNISSVFILIIELINVTINGCAVPFQLLNGTNLI